MNYFIPVLFLGVFLFAAVKKVPVYDSFVVGVKGAVPLLVSVFPYVTAVLAATELLCESGVQEFLTELLSPVWKFFGIPQQIAQLVLLKPFTGSGSTAMLDEILSSCGADSFAAKAACACYGSGETVFYIGAVYFSAVKKRNLAVPVGISLFSNFVATVVGCFACRFF